MMAPIDESTADVRHADEGPVVACIDFSEDSRAALAWAARFAERFDRPLILLHIVHDLASQPGFYLPRKANHLEPLQDVAESMMEEFLADMLSSYPDLSALATAEAQLVPGLPATRIVEVAGLLKAGLLAIGGHGQTYGSRKRLGMVAERVTEMSRVPVVVVKAEAGELSKKELKRKKKQQKKEIKSLRRLLGISGDSGTADKQDE